MGTNNDHDDDNDRSADDDNDVHYDPSPDDYCGHIDYKHHDLYDHNVFDYHDHNDDGRSNDYHVEYDYIVHYDGCSHHYDDNDRCPHNHDNNYDGAPDHLNIDDFLYCSTCGDNRPCDDHDNIDLIFDDYYFTADNHDYDYDTRRIADYVEHAINNGIGGPLRIYDDDLARSGTGRRRNRRRGNSGNRHRLLRWRNRR